VRVPKGKAASAHTRNGGAVTGAGTWSDGGGDCGGGLEVWGVQYVGATVGGALGGLPGLLCPEGKRIVSREVHEGAAGQGR